MQTINVSLIQFDIAWEDKKANFDHLNHLLENLETDLVVLPEMFTTGFSMKAVELAEAPNGPTTQWMQEKAGNLNAAIVGSHIAKVDGQYFNRLLWVFPDGHYQIYDKRHLFRMAKEQDIYTAGQNRLILNYKGWRFCPQICYDLRFPVWNRNQNDYDCLIFVANWPAIRTDAWSQLLKARAIENLAYVIGVNRVGNDGNEIYHSGKSAFIDFKGQVLSERSDATVIQQMDLLPEDFKAFRKKFPAWMDADSFTIEIETDPLKNK